MHIWIYNICLLFHHANTTLSIDIKLCIHIIYGLHAHRNPYVCANNCQITLKCRVNDAIKFAVTNSLFALGLFSNAMIHLYTSTYLIRNSCVRSQDPLDRVLWLKCLWKGTKALACRNVFVFRLIVTTFIKWVLEGDRERRLSWLGLTRL